MSHALGNLAASAASNWKRSLAIVAAVLVGLAVLAGVSGGGFQDEFSTPGTDSQQAIDLIEERFPSQAGDTATVVFAATEGKITDQANAERIEQIASELSDQPAVTSALSPLSPNAPGQISPDQRIAFITAQYDTPAAELGPEAGERVLELAEQASNGALEVSARGQIIDVAEQTKAPVGELIGVAVAVIVLTLVFGSKAAMAITLLSAGLALIGGILLLTFASAFTNFPTFAPTLGVMLGLGAGIDYALLIVGRYREQLAEGDDVATAAATANRTAGVSVVAAGAIVVVAIAGLLATGVPFLGEMGIGSAIVVATVAVGAVTVLPVIMGAASERLRPTKPEHTEPSPGFAAWAERIVARPWLATIGSVAFLLFLATPLTDLRLGQPDDGNDPTEATTRIAYDRLAEGFGPGFNGPLTIAVDLSEATDPQALEALAGRIAETEGVAAVAPPIPNPAGDTAILAAIPTTSPQAAATDELVDRLRTETLPAAADATGAVAYVGGITAIFKDLSQKIADSLPVFIGLVVGLAVLLLMAVFRSIWVPLISAGFNLLSIAAAYGVVVALFQFGWGGSVLGVPPEGIPIVSFVPLFMFAVLFGLSMDYNVFLQSRIREEYFKGAAPDRSVVIALSRVGKVILAAGAIMTAVFMGFVTDPDLVVKTIGLGLAVAILIDVLIVRMILAPAVMSLLGDRAWGLPDWLDRILPQISLEGEEPASGAAGDMPADPFPHGVDDHEFDLTYYRA